MSLLSSGKETSREVRQQEDLSPIESDDSEMENLLASLRRKKPRLKQPASELHSEGTEHTPLLKGKTSLRPRQRSRSTSASSASVDSEPASNEFYTPKRHQLKQVGQPKSGRTSATKNNTQRHATTSPSTSTSPQNHLPSPPSTSDPDDPLTHSRHSRDKRIPLETNSEEESSEEEENEDHEIGLVSKQNDPEKQMELSQALKDMTSVLNKLVKRVENNSNEIYALKNTLKSASTPSSSSESSSGSRKRKIPAVVQVCENINAFLWC